MIRAIFKAYISILYNTREISIKTITIYYIAKVMPQSTY